MARKMLLALAAAVALCGCLIPKPPEDLEPTAIRRIGEIQSGQFISVREYERIAIHVEKREGCTWRIAKSPDDDILKQADCRDYAARYVAMGEPEVVYCFDAVGPGIASLRLECSNGRRVAAYFELTVEVIY